MRYFFVQNAMNILITKAKTGVIRITYRYGQEAAKLSDTKLEKIKTFIIQGTIAEHIDSYKTHVIKKHCSISEVDGLDRILSEETQSHGFFMKDTSKSSSPEEIAEYAKYLVNEGMLYDINNVMNWLKDDTLCNGERHDIVMPIKPEDELGYVGNVFNRDKDTGLVREYKANSVRIVLERDESQALELQLITAYPESNELFLGKEKTGRDLQSLAIHTRTYQHGSDKQKTATLFQTNVHNKVPVKYFSTYSGKEFLHIDVKMKNTKNIYRIFIDKDRDQIVKQKHDKPGAEWLDSIYAKTYRDATQRTKGYCVDLENSDVQKIFKKHMPSSIQDAVIKVTIKLRSFDQKERPARFYKRPIALDEEK